MDEASQVKWQTTNQARDNLLEAAPLTTDVVRELKDLAHEANEARKFDTETYSKCPRCYTHHSIHGNFDNLCDRCQQIILEHFPDHPSVPHIKAALAKWSNVEVSRSAEQSKT